jgi:hypothetical protein
MDLTLLLTGMLPAVLIASAMLTAVTSLILLWLYRRRVLRLMLQLQGAAPAAALQMLDTDNRPAVDGHSLLIKEVQIDESPTDGYPLKIWRQAINALRTAGIIYTLGGLVFALVFTTAWMIFSGGGFALGRFLLLAVCHFFPATLTVNLVVAATNRERLVIAGGYALLVIAVIWFTLARNPELPILQPLQYWLLTNASGTVLLFIFLHPRIRSIAPLVLGFMTAGVAGAFLLIEAFRLNEAAQRLIVAIGGVVGLNATALFALLHVVGFAALGAIGWWLIVMLGKRYRAKRLSDQSITIDSLWLLFAVSYSIGLVFEGWGWIFTGLCAFATYKLTIAAGFWIMTKANAGPVEAPMLLWLRVFALGRRSELFFNAFSKQWRYSGGINLISGPDLMTKTVDPHEILDFISGRLAQHFVKSKEDLEQQITALDKQPDPDGRFRVNEFFCHADTWQTTMRRLADESHAILMDLRGFTPANQGCLYELEQLLQYIILERIVFLVDSSTDRVFLEETLRRLWHNIDRASPNRAASAPTVRFFLVIDHDRPTMHRLHQLLLDAQTVSYPMARRAGTTNR